MASIKIPSRLFRTAEFNRESVDPDKRTVSLSVSSDEPYERSFGIEILDHAPASIRMKRMTEGAPLLFNHQSDLHLGRIMDSSTNGKKMTIVAKFGNSSMAKEKLADVQDGILKEASIGYVVHKMEEEEKGTFRSKDWEPYECSLVTVPADLSVGVGRTDETREKELQVDTLTPTNQKAMADTPSDKPETKIDVVAEKQNAVADFKARVKKINEFVSAITNTKWQETARAVATKHTDGEANFEEFRTEALNAFDPAKHVEVPDTKIGMGKGDRKRFSIRKLILEANGTGRLTGIEKEACDAAREQLRKAGDNTLDNREGFTLPEDMALSNMAEDHDLDTRAMQRVLEEVRQLQPRFTRNLLAGTQNLGGYLIGTDLLTGSLIEYLRVRTVMSGMGIRQLDGLVNNVAIPRVTGTGSVYWLSEAASVTESSQAFGQLTLSPHRLASYTFYTKQLLNQASLSVEAFVREDLVAGQGVELDRVYINGSGVAGEPSGIFNTVGVGTITYSATPTLAKLLTQESDVAVANADIGSQAWLFSPASRSKLKATVAYSNTASPLWDAENRVIGYPATMSNNLPSNKSVFGVFSEFMAGRWAGLDVTVDPFTRAATEQIRVIMGQYVDCGIRHPVAFEISTDSAAQ